MREMGTERKPRRQPMQTDFDMAFRAQAQRLDV